MRARPSPQPSVEPRREVRTHSRCACPSEAALIATPCTHSAGNARRLLPASPRPLGSSRWGAASAARGRGRLACRAEAARDGEVAVKFTIQRELHYGERLKLVGSEPALGRWRLDAAPEMAWGEVRTGLLEVGCRVD